MPKTFGMSFYGYNKNEVNEFISNVTNEYESMLDKLKQTNEEMKKLRDDNSCGFRRYDRRAQVSGDRS